MRASRPSAETKIIPDVWTSSQSTWNLARLCLSPPDWLALAAHRPPLVAPRAGASPCAGIVAPVSHVPHPAARAGRAPSAPLPPTPCKLEPIVRAPGDHGNTSKALFSPLNARFSRHTGKPTVLGPCPKPRRLVPGYRPLTAGTRACAGLRQSQDDTRPHAAEPPRSPRPPHPGRGLFKTSLEQKRRGIKNCRSRTDARDLTAPCLDRTTMHGRRPD